MPELIRQTLEKGIDQDPAASARAFFDRFEPLESFENVDTEGYVREILNRSRILRVVAEIYAGGFGREHKMIENLFDHCHTVNVDRAIATQAGRYAKQFQKSFNGISPEDFLLASNARVHRCPLWTRNRKHFPMPDIEFIGEAGH